MIFYSTEEKTIVVKIKQFPRKEGDKPKFFKLKLQGVLGDKPLRKPKFKKTPTKISPKPFKSKPSSGTSGATSRPIIQKKKQNK